ncbi:MAG: hypothetical protein QOJ79_3212 [Actinomycetota bacterium]|nr:hypothetical protein [Actinomycetota bacterium]
MDDLLTRCAHAGIPVAPPTDAAVHAGTARLSRRTPMDEVHAREVTVAAQTAGRDHDERILIVPKLRAWQRPHRGGDVWRTPLPPWGMRLSRLIRSVRRAVGDCELLLEWADDGRRCRLVSVQRLA